ncbi:hypothetical protein ACA910_009024 [Epithemia clementina (nom. ined.)]
MNDVLILVCLFSLLNNLTLCVHLVSLCRRFCSALVTGTVLSNHNNIIINKLNASSTATITDDDSYVSLLADDDNNTLESSDESYDTPVNYPGSATRWCGTNGRSSESSPTSPSSSSYEKRARRVRFNNVSIRNYNVLPLSTSEYKYSFFVSSPRTSLTLDWTYTRERELPVELFERMRSVSYERKSHTRKKIAGLGKPVTVSPQQLALQIQATALNLDCS